MRDSTGPADSPDSATVSGIDDLLEMSCHPSGFNRENAVRRLGMLGDPAAIPHLIVRANDWVPQIRLAARDALIKLLRSSNGEAFVAALPAILHLQTCTRDDHGSLLQAVQDFLLRKEHLHYLTAGLQSPDPRVARLAIRLLMSQETLTSVELLSLGLSHSDVVVRSIVVDQLRTLDLEVFDAVIAQVLGDRYMPVRREAFQQVLARRPDKGSQVARRFLFDASASIREIAVRRLLHTGENIEGIYADALAEAPARATIAKCVLWGWGFMHSTSRSAQVLQLCRSPLATVRRSALVTIAKLLREGAGPFLRAGLSDDSPAVCNEAARLIVRMDGKPDVDELIAIVRGSVHPHVATACYRIARDGGKWGWLKFVLIVYGGPMSTVGQELFAREIHKWDAHFNRTSAQPDSKSLDDISAALRLCEAKMTAQQADLLKFTLRSYGVLF